MKYVFLNLKRFDIPAKIGGVNRLCGGALWGTEIIRKTQDGVKQYRDCTFAHFFPEAHIIPAILAKNDVSTINIGCQSVFREDVSVGGNFGAFTSNRTANSMKNLGCTYTIIGHCEERKDKQQIMEKGGKVNLEEINKLLNEEIKCALNAGLKVLYCIGETMEEQPQKYDILRRQLEIGLYGVDKSSVIIAYEPIWAIGPGKTPPDREYIKDIATHIKKVSGGIPVVYGGGLKTDNAKMLASIPEIDGGLIALTRFSGEIGFYPEEYLEIVKNYLEG